MSFVVNSKQVYEGSWCFRGAFKGGTIDVNGRSVDGRRREAGGARRWAVPASACSRLRRAELFVTEMAEGELDVDSLISRLLEGEFTTAQCSYQPVVCDISR